MRMSRFAAAAEVGRRKPCADALPSCSRDLELEAEIDEAIALLPSWLADPANAAIVEQMTSALRAPEAAPDAFPL
jgi:hypothetical protein